MCKAGLRSDVYKPISLYAWYDDRHDKALQFDTGVNDLYFHSRSQGYEKARSCAIVLW